MRWTRRVRSAVVTTGLLLGAGGLDGGYAIAAQDPGALVTDRPDQAESTEVVPVGFHQIETGWLSTRFLSPSDIEITSARIPGTLLRSGLLPGLELRLGYGGWVSETVTGSSLKISESGTADLDLGFKWRLLEPSGARPAVAVIGTVVLPTGSVGAGRTLPSLLVAFSHDVHDRVGLGYNLRLGTYDVEGIGGEIDLRLEYGYSLVAGIGVSDRLGAFLEVFGAFANEPMDPDRHSVGGGLTFLLKENIQLDLTVGYGLSEWADDLSIGLGISVRLPR